MLATHSARLRSTISRLARDGSRFRLGLLEHGPDAVQPGHRGVGELVLGPHGQEEQLGDPRLEIGLGGTTPLLPAGHGQAPLQPGDDQRPVDGLVEREVGDIELLEAPEPAGVAVGPPLEAGGGQIVEPVVETVPAHHRGHPRAIRRTPGP